MRLVVDLRTHGPGRCARTARRSSHGAAKTFILPFDRSSLRLEANVMLRRGDIVFVPESWL